MGPSLDLVALNLGEIWWNWRQYWASHRQGIVTPFTSGYSNSTNLLIKSPWFESTFKSWLINITFSASHIALEFLCLNTLLTRPRMWVYTGKIPRDGSFVYQRCLAQARVIEGRMLNIGLPVTQPHLPPGSQSPSYHLALLPRASPGDGCAVTEEVEGQDWNGGQSGAPEDKIDCKFCYIG